MKVNSIKAGILGIIALCTASCAKPALKRSAHPMLTKSTMALVDSFAREGKKIINNPEYKCYAIDTVYLETFMTPGMLERRLMSRANNAMPMTKVGERYEEHLKLMGKVLYSATEKVDVSLPNYIDVKPVIKNEYYKYNWYGSEHIPVRYYGKPNPQLRK